MPLFCFLIRCLHAISFFFFFNDTATTEIYTLSLHDALPILQLARRASEPGQGDRAEMVATAASESGRDTSREKLDRKSTRLNSSHLVISYAVFCLKKKKKKHIYHLSNMSS